MKAGLQDIGLNSNSIILVIKNDLEIAIIELLFNDCYQRL